MKKQKLDPFEAAFEQEQEYNNQPSPQPQLQPFATRGTDNAVVNNDDNEVNSESDYEKDDNTSDDKLKKFFFIPDPNNAAKMKDILSQLTEGQTKRYEAFRRSSFQRFTIKKLVASTSGTQIVPETVTIVVAGLAKLFVGDVVEKGEKIAKVVMSERNDMGPIRPCHIREAHRRLKLEGKVPQKIPRPRLFR